MKQRWLAAVKKDFYDAAKAEGIKPIIGQEFYIAPGSRFEKKNADGVSDGQAYHLVLLARNDVGYKNLIKHPCKQASRDY